MDPKNEKYLMRIINAFSKFYLAFLLIICSITFCLMAMQSDEIFPYNLQEICENLHHCACCSQAFHNNQEFIEHIKDVHALPDNKGYICPCATTNCCGFETTNPNMLILHLPIHTDEHINLCSCCYLNIRSDYQPHFELHKKYKLSFLYLMLNTKKVVRNYQGRLVCPCCRYPYIHLAKLLRHIEKEHPKELIELDSTTVFNFLNQQEQEPYIIQIDPEQISTRNPLPEASMSKQEYLMLPQPAISTTNQSLRHDIASYFNNANIISARLSQLQKAFGQNERTFGN